MIRWRNRAIAFAVIVAVVLVIDWMTGADALGATGRFAWNLFVFLLARAAWVLEWLPTVVLRRRFGQLTWMVMSVGLGYAASIILTESRVGKLHTLRAKNRATMGRMRRWWIGLSTPMKLLLTGALILAQVMLLPSMHEYLLLFPVGFMIPLLVGLWRRLYGWIADSIVLALYLKYFGRVHAKAAHWVAHLRALRALVACVRLVRLRYLTAWRLWKYDPRYRDERGELWVSFIEPVRLWRAGKLDIYVGHPLLHGKRQL